jgi:hypothetical protein
MGSCFKAPIYNRPGDYPVVPITQTYPGTAMTMAQPGVAITTTSTSGVGPYGPGQRFY